MREKNLSNFFSFVSDNAISSEKKNEVKTIEITLTAPIWQSETSFYLNSSNIVIQTRKVTNSKLNVAIVNLTSI